MNNKLINVLTFAAGATIGSLVAWSLTKRKYESIIDEEVQSVKDMFAFKRPQPSDEEYFDDFSYPEHKGVDFQVDPKFTKQEINSYLGVVDDQDYTNYSNVETERFKNKLDTSHKKPYVISTDDLGNPYSNDEFGDPIDQDVAELYLYADGILANYDDDIIEGEEALELIGDSALDVLLEEDSVGVRNERIKTDFIILKKLENYEDAADPLKVKYMERYKEFMESNEEDDTLKKRERKPHEVDE